MPMTFNPNQPSFDRDRQPWLMSSGNLGILETISQSVRADVALAVAPGLQPMQVMAALREHVDPVFLPRPLRLVDALPRNETGKLTHDALMRLLHDRAAD